MVDPEEEDSMAVDVAGIEVEVVVVGSIVDFVVVDIASGIVVVADSLVRVDSLAGPWLSTYFLNERKVLSGWCLVVDLDSHWWWRCCYSSNKG